ncbi:iron ABC transporter permease [Campylobacter sp. 7477a]|uniref:iron ABC transporter permease n=1 Tax=Campylobacter sp. 7477a TaxID=2735741 RepID=UPI0030148D7D|nr:iron ABC transporter permease [Campylobacter sp. 7477a]
MKNLSITLFVIFALLAAIAVFLEFNALSEYENSIKNLVIFNYTLPRLGVAVLSGAFLALASALMAQITNNPLASDSTLGVSNGAGFMLLVFSLLFPNLVFGDIAAAFLGSVLALSILLLLSLGRGFSVFTTTLSGLIIGLFFSSLSTILIIFFNEESAKVAIWLSGDLAQEGTKNFIFMLGYFLPIFILILIFSRSFELFSLGDSTCKALGVNVTKMRILGLLIAAYLSAIVVAHVGIIGFIGLGACAIVGRFKINSFLLKLFYSGILGALLLGITDALLLIILNLTSINLPSGSVSAFLGAPLLLWMIFYGIKEHESIAKSSESGSSTKEAKSYFIYIVFGILMFCFGFSLFFNFSGFEILSVRFSRVLAALASGIALGVVGVILQRLSQNEMASPELLGINSGVSFGVLAAIFFAPFLSVPLGIVGACAVLGIMVAINYKNGMLPQKVILTGIAIISFVSATWQILLAVGDSRVYNFIAYASGSTYSVTFFHSLLLFGFCVITVIFGIFFSREIEILNLGEVNARAVGVDIFRYRIILFGFCAIMSAIMALSIGPVSFVGLLAPHLASFLGFFKVRAQILAASFLGGVIMLFADFIGRNLITPYEISSGLIATIIGSFYFVIVMRKIR